MTPQDREKIVNHVQSMVTKAQDAGRGLDAVAREARGDLLGTEWAASIAEAFGPESGAESAADMIARAQRVRREVAPVAQVIAGRLYEGSRALIDAAQRRIYAEDQQKRARLFNAQTNPEWQIVAEVTEPELARLAEIPLEGHSRDERLAVIAAEWRATFAAGVVRAVGASAGALRPGLRAIDQLTRKAFEAWVRKADSVASLAALAAMQASALEFRQAFVPPERRTGITVQVA